MTFEEWAMRHPVAYAELVMVTTHMVHRDEAVAKSEANVQSRVILEGAGKDIPLFRNNVGALKDKNGRLVRYGLANDSKDVNSEVKSGDLIGLESVLITPAHVGSIIGRFVSRECKPEDWKYTGTEREVAQLAWATYINQRGGNAAIVNCEGSL